MRKKQERMSLVIPREKRIEIRTYCELNRITMSDYFLQLYEQERKNNDVILEILKKNLKETKGTK